MTETLPDDVVLAWTRLLRAQRVTLAAVEAELKAAGLPPLGWYDVLWELERAGAPLRPLELETRLLLAQHNVSRLLDRMETAGVVARAPFAGDGRGQVVEITAEGREVRRRMWAVYGPAIRRHVGEPLGDSAASLSTLLGRLLPRQG